MKTKKKKKLELFLVQEKNKKGIIVKEMRKLSDLDIRFMPFGNREVKADGVDAIRHSINKIGDVRNIVVAYTNVFGKGWGWYILDGQHLYRSLEALEYLDYSYANICLEKFDNVVDLVTVVAELNAKQKKWNLNNYVDAFASTKLLPSYNILQKKVLLYNLTIQITAVIYGGADANLVSRQIKAGTFKTLNIKKGNQVCKDIKEILDIFGGTNHTLTRVFAHAFYDWYNSITYDSAKLKKFILNNKEKFEFLKKDGMQALLVQSM